MKIDEPFDAAEDPRAGTPRTLQFVAKHDRTAGKAHTEKIGTGDHPDPHMNLEESAMHPQSLRMMQPSFPRGGLARMDDVRMRSLHSHYPSVQAGPYVAGGNLGGRAPWRLAVATGTWVSCSPLRAQRSIRPPRLMSPRPANSAGKRSRWPKIFSKGSTYFGVAMLPRRTTSHLVPMCSAIKLASRSRGMR